VDRDWEKCEYQHDYNLPLIYHGKNKLIKCHCLTSPQGQGGHKFTYIYLPTVLFRLFIYFQKTDIHIIFKFIQKDTLPKFSRVSTDMIKI
jgi:hypothetical protein